MENELFIKLTEKIKKGQYTSIVYRTMEKNGSYKLVHSVAQFLNYNPMRDNPSYDPNNYNPRMDKYEKIGKYGKAKMKKDGTMSYTCLLWISKGKNHFPKIQYFLENGTEISKAEYEMLNPPKNHPNPTTCYTKKIEDIISINGVSA